MNSAVRSLLEAYPLSSGWAVPEIFQETVQIGKCKLFLAGLSTSHESGQSVSGSAAQTGKFPWVRGYFELLERTSIIEAEASDLSHFDLINDRGFRFRKVAKELVCPSDPFPEKWRYSKSNGVAAHTTWKQASSSAAWELIERDRVLRSWRGEITPQRILTFEERILLSLKGYYEFFCCDFPDPNHPSEHVAGVFAFPITNVIGPIYGFGARDDLSAALERAWGECLQRIGFLWGESSSEVLDFSPTPDYHQEYYLLPENTERLKDWLSGKHKKFCQDIPQTKERRTIYFADITPAKLQKKLCAVKAICSHMLPLTFGHCPTHYPEDFPSDLIVHPIA